MVTQPNDTLVAISIERMMKGIQTPDSPLAEQVTQLRTVKAMDENQYRRLKTQLPYIVCGMFSPAIRRKENFSYAEYFILDLDHLTQFERTSQVLKDQLKSDENILMMFVSPGNDGLKLLFKIQERIHDVGYYTLFYKQFAARFAALHELQGMVDIKTNDVSRCCFMSHDNDLVYNEHALPVIAADYLNPDNIDGLENTLKEIKEADIQQQEQLFLTADATVDLPKSILPDDVLLRIKMRINPSLIVRPKKVVTQPGELNEIWGKLQVYLEEMEIPIEKMTPISYGRQIRLKADMHWAELNIFYGKKGYSVVKTTKTGSSEALAEIAYNALQQFFNQL